SPACATRITSWSFSAARAGCARPATRASVLNSMVVRFMCFSFRSEREWTNKSDRAPSAEQAFHFLLGRFPGDGAGRMLVPARIGVVAGRDAVAHLDHGEHAAH